MRHGTLTRRAEFGAAVDLAARSVPIVVASEAPVMRDGFAEVLSMRAVDLSRAPLPLIESHDATRVNIGIVDQLRVDGDVLRGVAIFGMSARAAELLADVQAGIVRGVSVGYRHTDDGREITLPDGRRAWAFAWQPHEASIVAIPADVRAGFYRSHGVRMNNTTAAPADEVRALTRGLPAEFADALIAAGVTADQARTAATTELARRDAAAGGCLNVAPAGHFTRGASDFEATKRRMVDALAATRFGVMGIDLSANEYRHAALVDLCRDLLEARGERTTFMSRPQLVQRSMMGTGDLPNLLAAAGHRSLRAVFDEYTDGVHRAAHPSTIADFRAKTLIRLSEAPELRKVNEHGEFTYGAVSEAAESYRLHTFGRLVSLTRQAIINDDLGALARIPQAFGRAAADLRNGKLVELLALNSAAGPQMEDGVVCFHVDHNNLQTGGGSALDLSSLATARRMMRLQRDIGGRTLLDLAPRFLIVPAALENTARQLLAQISPTTVADVNAAGGGLELVVDPRLDAVSTTGWYLESDPRHGGLEYSYLEGAEGPQLEQEWGLEVDGVVFKCRLDFGATINEWRTLHRAAGA